MNKSSLSPEAAVATSLTPRAWLGFNGAIHLHLRSKTNHGFAVFSPLFVQRWPLAGFLRHWEHKDVARKHRPRSRTQLEQNKMLHFTARGESLSVSTEGRVSHVVASPGSAVCEKRRGKSLVSSQGAGKLFSFPGCPSELNQCTNVGPRATQEQAV